jgi:small subunit ribosomal protein S15
MLKNKKKEKVIGKYKAHKTDTGSADVQIALLTERIKELLGHLKEHPKDVHSKRGLLKMVSKRRKLLAKLQKESTRKYNFLIKKIGLKK